MLISKFKIFIPSRLEEWVKESSLLYSLVRLKFGHSFGYLLLFSLIRDHWYNDDFTQIINSVFGVSVFFKLYQSFSFLPEKNLLFTRDCAARSHLAETHTHSAGAAASGVDLSPFCFNFGTCTSNGEPLIWAPS